MRLLNTLSAVSLLTLCSCASIMAGMDSTIEVDSVPSGVAFTTNYAGMQGVTPATLNVPNGDVLEVSFTAPEGYHPLEFSSDPTVSGWIWGNILLGGLIGIGVDVLNENSRTHNDILVELMPVGATEAEGYPEVVEEELEPLTPEG